MLLKDTWKSLFEKGINLINSVKIPSNKWSFGGGTALYVFWKCPRVSKDLDFFLTDVQWLTYLTPRLNDLADSLCGGNYVEQANFVKLILDEGDIDFIVAPWLTEKPVVRRKIEPFGLIQVDTPWEVIAKKFFYRADYFTIRDVVDFLAVTELYHSRIPEGFWDLLRNRLSNLKDRWAKIKPSAEKVLAKIVIDPERRFLVKSINDPKTMCWSFDKLLKALEGPIEKIQKDFTENEDEESPSIFGIDLTS